MQVQCENSISWVYMYNTVHCISQFSLLYDIHAYCNIRHVNGGLGGWKYIMYDVRMCSVYVVLQVSVKYYKHKIFLCKFCYK